MSLALAGGLGPILGVFGEMYAPEGYGRADISLLLTLPSLFIGIGKFSIQCCNDIFTKRIKSRSNIDSQATILSSPEH